MRKTNELNNEVNIEAAKSRQLKVSDYLHFIPVEETVDEKGCKDTISIGWNRYFPSVFILNNQARHILDELREGLFPETDNDEDAQMVSEFIEALKEYRFVFEGDSDPSREEFSKMVRESFKRPEEMAEKFYREKQDYSELKVVSDECNLTCSYCVNQYQADPTCQFLQGNARMKAQDKIKLINRCLDQFMSRKIANKAESVNIFFNGGEILLEWDIIKHIVQRVARKYKGIEAKYEMNTNLTLLTPEMAQFLHEHDFKVAISIDGYKESHNKTRKFRNGAGSFDTIIEKVKMFRKYGEGKDHVLEAFQGTLEHIEDFRPGEVYRMKAYGFNHARLAPNLLNTSAEDGVKKARLMGQFLELNDRRDFKVVELIFNQCKRKINREKYAYEFNCRGLSALPKMGIEINLSSLCVSHLCGFIPGAAIPLPDLDYDIYNPKLWDTTFNFIKNRMETVLSDCMECPLVAICAGGCILNGLDNENKINPAACAYQNEMWKIYSQKAYSDNKKSDLQEEGVK